VFASKCPQNARLAVPVIVERRLLMAVAEKRKNYGVKKKKKKKKKKIELNCNKILYPRQELVSKNHV
jgi:hypothetical protein